jgi:tRNA(adenine34) deaminase
MTFSSTTDSFPSEILLDERDGRYLRKAIGWSHAARRRGNRPFGAIVVTADSEVLAEAYSNTIETQDCIGHAEINAIRMLAGRGISREALANATLYASGEPCAMCAGAIVLSHIGRVVFGLDAARLRVLQGRPQGQQRRDAGVSGLSGLDVLRAALPGAIECVGPALLDEAAAAHDGAWKA